MVPLAAPARQPTSDDVYRAYLHAFGELRKAAGEPLASLASLAMELRRLLSSYPPAAGPALTLALADALGCLPAKSAVHFLRVLEEPGAVPPRCREGLG